MSYVLLVCSMLQLFGTPILSHTHSAPLHSESAIRCLKKYANLVFVRVCMLACNLATRLSAAVLLTLQCIVGQVHGNDFSLVSFFYSVAMKLITIQLSHEVLWIRKMWEELELAVTVPTLIVNKLCPRGLQWYDCVWSRFSPSGVSKLRVQIQ